MKFIELHCATGGYILNFDKVISMRWEVINNATLAVGTKIETTDKVFYCQETPEEIFQKIAEAEPHSQTFGDIPEQEG